MKLVEAIDIGKACGLDSIEECVDNIVIHAGSFFAYSEMNKELDELISEYDNLPDV